MKVLLLLIGVLTGLNAHAQYIERIDSLKQQLTLKEGQEKIALLYNIAWEYRNSTPDSTIAYAWKALEIAKDYDIQMSQAKAYNFVGIAYHYKGDYVNSFDYLSQGLQLSQNLKDSIQYGHALNTLGRLFMVQGDLVKSYNYFWKAKEVFEKIESIQGLSYSYKSLAELYQDQNNIPKALEMLQESLIIRHEAGDERGQISILNELAQLYRGINNYDQAFKYYLNAKTIASKIDDKVSIAEINIGIAAIYYDQSKNEEALNFCKQAENIIADLDNDDLRSRLYLEFGNIYMAMYESANAKIYLEKVVVLGKESGNKHIQMQAYDQLYRKADREGDIKTAYSYFQNYHELRKSLQDADKAREIERLEARLEIENKERENEILLAEQARDQAIIRQQQFEKLGLVILALIISGFMANLWITAKKRRKANEKLEMQKAHIAAQKSEITRQNERINMQYADLHKRNEELGALNEEKDNLMNIMAHDLKGPFNRVVGLVELIKMTHSQDDDTNKYLQMMKDVSLSGIALIRDLLDVHAFEVDKSSIKHHKLDLEFFINQILINYQSELEAKNLEIVTEFKDIDFDFYTDEVYLSRIIDNLISNAVKFSYPDRKISISAYSSEDNVNISISDNGQGFSEEDKKNIYKKFRRLSAKPTGGESSNGLGLAIVRLLVDQLNGEIELKSEKNVGSEFILQFPLKQVKSVETIEQQ